MTFRKLLPLLFVFTSLAAAGRPHAKNVVLFVGDAGGIATLHAASVYRHGEPQGLFIQRMPHFALMDTSSATEWVADSASAMTAIVTGQKTLNGVLSQSADAVRGERDGEWLKTILEEAEERGLSTGIVTNMAVTDATPAACYAHVSARANARDIVTQFFTPRFGDGVDVLIGAPPALRGDTAGALATEMTSRFQAAGYTVLASVTEPITNYATRVAALLPGGEFDVQQAIEVATGILRKNPRGYFLMVEWDMHTSRLQRGLERVAEMDAAIERTARSAAKDTLVIFTADHSYDLRMRSGKKGEPILPAQGPPAEPIAAGQIPAPQAVRVEDGHTGEQVLVAAQGPGAEAVHGFLVNTDLYRVMREAYGWSQPTVTRRPAVLTSTP